MINISKENKQKFISIAIITAIILILDLITKYLTHKKQINIEIPPFLSITTVENFGAGFGILQDKVILLSLVSIILIGIMIYITTQIPNKKIYVISMGLIISGAIGNLIDRLFIGFVRDFINFHFFPVFNIADSAISIGVTILIIQELFYNNKNKKSKK